MKRSEFPVRFITFEGGEGVGKSTQVKRVSKLLDNFGIQHIVTREPGGSPGAEEIRKLLVEGEPARWDAETETLLHFAAHRDRVTGGIDDFHESALARCLAGELEHISATRRIEKVVRGTQIQSAVSDRRGRASLRT